MTSKKSVAHVERVCNSLSMDNTNNTEPTMTAKQTATAIRTALAADDMPAAFSLFLDYTCQGDSRAQGIRSSYIRREGLTIHGGDIVDHRAGAAAKAAAVAACTHTTTTPHQRIVGNSVCDTCGVFVWNEDADPSMNATAGEPVVETFNAPSSGARADGARMRATAESLAYCPVCAGDPDPYDLLRHTGGKTCRACDGCGESADYCRCPS